MKYMERFVYFLFQTDLNVQLIEILSGSPRYHNWF